MSKNALQKTFSAAAILPGSVDVLENRAWFEVIRETNMGVTARIHWITANGERVSGLESSFVVSDRAPNNPIRISFIENLMKQKPAPSAISAATSR